MDRVIEEGDAQGLVQATLLGEAVEQASHAVFVSEEDFGRLVAVNEAACTLLGYPRDELLRLTARDYAIDGEHALEVYERLRVHRSSVYEQTRLRRRDGTVVEIGYWGSHTRLGGVDFLLTVTEPIERARPVASE
ncbi:MAG TPA: PAS domain-containing protein [Gaiellaceae bacterium]|nr:PAS domain-containing protein [Gaiellaceae bacterium]